ncbi:MAG: hypothetical protein ACOC2E_03370 [Bacteroidota bacterium]
MEKSILKVDPVAFRYNDPEINDQDLGEENDYEWDREDLDDEEFSDDIDEDFDEDFDPDIDEDFEEDFDNDFDDDEDF